MAIGKENITSQKHLNFFSCCFSCWKPNQLCSSWVLTWCVISPWGLNLSRLHEGFNSQAESSVVVKENGIRQAGDIWKVSYAHGAMKEGPVCTALTSLLCVAQSEKSSVSGHRHVGQDVTVRCDTLHLSCSTLDPDHICENYWKLPQQNKIELSPCSWPSGQPQHRHSYTETELFLSLAMPMKVQLLCAAGGWHQVSPASLCGTVWRHKDRQGWRVGTLILLTLRGRCTLCMLGLPTSLWCLVDSSAKSVSFSF